MKDTRQRKIDLFNAILALENLIKNGTMEESAYQHCFEENPIIFESLGYLEFHVFTKEAKKDFPRDEFSGLKPEPDFIVKNSNGIYEIFELKTPIDKKFIITSNKYRERFTAELSSYISQTITYNEYFTRNPANRQKVEDMFGIKIQEDIPQSIIFGLDKNVDTLKMHKLCNRYRDRINIITYSKILESLERAYSTLQGGEEGIKGCSIHLRIKFDRIQKNMKNYVLDTARDNKSDRLSVYFDKSNNLVFEIISSDSRKYHVILPENQVNLFDDYIYIALELGVLVDSFFMSIYVNAIEAEKRYVYFPLNIDLSKLEMYIGTSFTRDQSCKFQLGRFAYNNHTMTFRERTYLYHLMIAPGGVMNFHGSGEHFVIPNMRSMENKIDHNPLPQILYGAGGESAKVHMKMLNDFVYPLVI